MNSIVPVDHIYSDVKICEIHRSDATDAGLPESAWVRRRGSLQAIGGVAWKAPGSQFHRARRGDGNGIISLPNYRAGVVVAVIEVVGNGGCRTTLLGV
jgi:hypothetical protein